MTTTLTLIRMDMGMAITRMDMGMAITRMDMAIIRTPPAMGTKTTAVAMYFSHACHTTHGWRT
jgi:hypothetical protein